MIEIIWHGRGGQGAFTAARLLGTAATLKDGLFALAFPSFGPERRGAPMRAFTKIANHPIGDRSVVTKADFVIYLDETLVGDTWCDELKPSGKVLVNTANTQRFNDERIIPFNANELSRTYLGRELPNTALLGALSALMDDVTQEQLLAAVEISMNPKLVAKNQEVVQAASQAMSAYLTDEVSFNINEQRVDEASARGVNFPDVSEDVNLSLVGVSQAPRQPVRIPTLEQDELLPEDFAVNTCFKAGHLDHNNAGWRSVRPVVNKVQCSGCLQCYLYCPDGAIYTVAKDDKRCTVAIDYGFCKGCGICVKECRFNALVLVSEQAALSVEQMDIDNSTSEDLCCKGEE